MPMPPSIEVFGSPTVVAEESMGSVQVDPTALLAPGQVMDIEIISIQVQMVEGMSAGNFPMKKLFYGALLSMVFRDETGDHTLGSAVLVAPGIAICAQHVVAEYEQALKAGHCALICGGPALHGATLWIVAAVSNVPDSDLAVLYMTLASVMPPQNQFIVAHLTTRTPAIGELVALYGLPAHAKTSFPVDGSASIPVSARYTSGRVLEVHLDGRDKVMMPGPCFAVACSAFGGMSGGPVFDEDGFLIGIVSTSYDGEDPIAYVSQLWPVFALRTYPVWPSQRPFPGLSFIELSKMGLIYIQNPEFIEVQPEAKFNIKYTHWNQAWQAVPRSS